MEPDSSTSSDADRIHESRTVVSVRDDESAPAAASAATVSLRERFEPIALESSSRRRGRPSVAVGHNHD